MCRREAFSKLKKVETLSNEVTRALSQMAQYVVTKDSTNASNVPLAKVLDEAVNANKNIVTVINEAKVCWDQAMGSGTNEDLVKSASSIRASSGYSRPTMRRSVGTSRSSKLTSESSTQISSDESGSQQSDPVDVHSLEPGKATCSHEDYTTTTSPIQGTLDNLKKLTLEDAVAQYDDESSNQISSGESKSQQSDQVGVDLLETGTATRANKDSTTTASPMQETLDNSKTVRLEDAVVQRAEEQIDQLMEVLVDATDARTKSISDETEAISLMCRVMSEVPMLIFKKVFPDNSRYKRSYWFSEIENALGNLPEGTSEEAADKSTKMELAQSLTNKLQCRTADMENFIKHFKLDYGRNAMWHNEVERNSIDRVIEVLCRTHILDSDGELKCKSLSQMWLELTQVIIQAQRVSSSSIGFFDGWV